MKETKVSVVIIAKNEEKKISRCLESVKWADDIIIVDGFSTDATPEIARSFGAKVVQHKFSGSFAEERNIGMQNAKNDWVLQLDADDVVTEDFLNKAMKALGEGGDAVLYKFRRKNFFLGHSMNHGGFHHYIPNLINKRRVKYEGDVHEVPVYEGKMGIIEADIEHYPFDSVAEFLDRQNRYTDIAARDIFRKEGLMKESRIKKETVYKSFKIFWKSYIKKGGFMEGFYGLTFAILFSFINVLKWAKYWEICTEGERTIK